MYSLLKRILPEKYKYSIWRFCIKLIQPKLIDQDGKIPKYRYKPEHIKNVKLILDRHELLRLLPKNAVVAELGVNKGEFSKEILYSTNPQKLHLIDIWNSERYHQGLKLDVEETFKKELEANKIEINLGLSTEVVKAFPDNYFDWIYIDTEHSYHVTRDELDSYAPKIKPGGIIAGHDYVIGNWLNITRYGVIEAVCEFCNKNDWELLYLTVDFNEPPSFAIRKINP